MTTSEVTIEMDDQPDHLSDAFAFFGAPGDLAYKKIFPALHNRVRQGTLKVPVIGIAKSGWSIDQLRERARDSIEEFGGGVDEACLLASSSK
jgi:glucose-6-phosphate 1-dehydrogenase